MRIISKYKDYYDIGAAFYDKNDVVYLRESSEIDMSNLKHPSFGHFFVIGFCGKLYTTFYWPKKDSVELYTFGEKEYLEAAKNFHYSLEDSAHAIMDGMSKKELERFLDKKSPLGYYGHYFSVSSKNELKHAMDGVEREIYPKVQGWFDQYKKPIFVYNVSKKWLTLDPILKYYRFESVLDPYTAFQELNMYFNSVLIEPPKSIPKIDDVTMASIKGFDKYSFRKDKKGDVS